MVQSFAAPAILQMSGRLTPAQKTPSNKMRFYGIICSMEPAFILFLIFGICLMLAAGWIYLLKDPRDSVFFARAHSLKKMPQEEAKTEAEKTAKYVALIGGIVIIISILGMLFIR